MRNLVKQYGDNTAVDHISFTIEKGRIYGFLGPNGAGKSTTMNIITGYLGPTDGSVTVNGHDILEEPEEAKRCIGYLPENPPLYADMTVREYLKFAAELKKIPKASRNAEIDKVVALTRIEEMSNRLIANLSKGYRQRVGLAQAIMGLPDVIILDEPTVGLDPNQIIEVRNLIRELAKDHTVILSSHILAEVQEICDQILIISQGKLVANGTPEELEASLGSASLELTVKSKSDDHVKSIFTVLPGVIGYEKIGNSNPGEISVRLKLKKGVDLREDVYNACNKAELPLLMLKSTEFSLEHIFLELTRAKKKTVKRKIKAAKDTAENDTHKHADNTEAAVDSPDKDPEKEDEKA
ncbi:MAG: ABC transporter ATP-binding protein [Oscillospiraceae bacterium]